MRTKKIDRWVKGHQHLKMLVWANLGQKVVCEWNKGSVDFLLMADFVQLTILYEIPL